MMTCPWCKSSTVDLPVKTLLYHRCLICEMIFLDPKHRLDPSAEKARYEKHENNINDAGYLAFARPLFEAVQNDQTKEQVGLDYGSGPDSAIHYLLREKGFQISQYDPFFKRDLTLLEKKYDFIILSEVAEHLYEPGIEFEKIRNLLKPAGVIFVMTSLLEKGLDFENWSYRRDATHVCFYSEKTFATKFAAEKLGTNLLKLKINPDIR